MEDAVIDGGAVAPADTNAAVISQADADRAPQALGSQIPPDQREPQAPVIDKSGKSIDDSIARAEAKVAEKQSQLPDDKEKPSKPVDDKAKPADVPKVEKPAPQRGEHGHFAAKDQQQGTQQPGQQPNQQQAPVGDQQKPQRWEAPARFSPEGKQAWETAPEPVKAEVHRALSEMQRGIDDHQKRWEPIKQYDDLAKQNGTELHKALERYVAFDRHLSENLIEGLEGVIRDKTGGKFGLREIAAHVMQMQPDAGAVQQDNATHQAQARFGHLERSVGAIINHLQQQASSSAERDVAAFADGKADFDVLAPKIAEHIRAGMGLDEAYTKAQTEAQELARSLGFIPQGEKPANAAEPLKPAAAEAAPLNPAGRKSVSGPPSQGAVVPKRKGGSLPSIDETLDRVLPA